MVRQWFVAGSGTRRLSGDANSGRGLGARGPEVVDQDRIRLVCLLSEFRAFRNSLDLPSSCGYK